MNLNQKKAIVTGASSGLGNTFIPVAMDVYNQKAISLWVENTFSNSYIPDILINNAGAGYFRKIDELSSEQWHEMINSNLKVLFI